MREEEKKQRNDAIALRVQQGETFTAIAEVLGISRERVRQIAKRRGVKRVVAVRSTCPGECGRVQSYHGQGKRLCHDCHQRQRCSNCGANPVHCRKMCVRCYGRWLYHNSEARRAAHIVRVSAWRARNPEKVKVSNKKAGQTWRLKKRLLATTAITRDLP